MASVRPKIDYPPVDTREWIPPDLRPKKKREPKYIKPEGITQKLAVSNLYKIWHHFRVYEERALLLGSLAETHKRFRLRSNGYQTPCNCVVAIVYSQLIPMSKWDFTVIVDILHMGNDLYMSSIHHQSDRSKTHLSLCEVYPSFYYGDTKVTISTKGKKYCGKIFEDEQNVSTPYLFCVIKEFFEENVSGIITVKKRFLAIWVLDDHYFLFDPTEHDCRGCPWKGLRGLGYAACMRFNTTDDLVRVCHEKFCIIGNPKFTIVPCYIVRLVKICTAPPKRECSPELPVCNPRKPPEICCEEKEHEKETCSVLIEREEIPDDEEEECDINNEYSPDVGRLTMSPSEYDKQGLPMPEGGDRSPITKCPLQCVRVKSITYYLDIVQEKMGILRASTHQCDPCYTKHNGKQSFANAVMALTMLRVYKSKEWFKKIVDDILKFGEKYYGDCLVANSPKTKMKISNISKTVTLYDVRYTPEVCEYFTIGRLQSTDCGVLDLLPALQEFFRCSPTCVITGPLVLALWFEDGYFYMFDPNERDCKGRVLKKCIETCNQIQLLDYVPGFACVTWFSDLKDLVDLYMINIPPSKRHQQFLLSRVIIKDWECLAPKYHCYEGLSPCKWILRGTFHENDRRFQKEIRNKQGTAASAIACALDYLKPAKTWTIADVDEILIIAEDYYVDTVNDLKARNKFVEPKLLVTELMRQCTIECTEVSIDVNDCAIYGLIEGSENEVVLDLNTGICMFFKDNEYGILTCRGQSVAIWKLCGCYYYYDPHSRDENGFRNYYGTACVLRFMKTRQLALCLISNLEPGTNDTFNISGLRFTVWEKDEECGIIRPPLHNYKAISCHASILRTCSSERSERFKLNAGKQTIPMCLVAVGMMKLTPSSLWTVDIMEEILTVGDKLFTDTMVDREMQENLSDKDDIDEVYAENCLLTYHIGMNKFTIEYKPPLTGNFDQHFKKKMMNFYKTPPVNCHDRKELFITNNFYNVVTWFDGTVYYLFDPKPRDSCGQIYGKEEWSAKIDVEGEEGEDYDYDRLDAVAIEKLGGSGDANVISVEAVAKIKKDGDDDELVTRRSASFWREQEDEKGAACTMWFLTFDKLIEHVYENTPPNRRRDLSFKLYPLIVHNKPDLMNCFDPALSAREDNYSGDWYAFKEVDYGRWILRGWYYNMYVMFPEENRGKQQLAMCYVALVFAKMYDLRCYDAITVNDVLKYGDRLYTATRGKVCIDEINDDKNLGLTVQECESLLCRQQLGIKELLTKFCIGKDEIKVKVITNVTVGDIHARKTSTILDVPRGLKDFFDKGLKYGIFMCRNYIVAIWRGVNVYYLFDSNSRGPCGLHCPGGEACITRYLNTDVMADVILHNIGKEEVASFAIHQVRLCFDTCPRKREEEERKSEEDQPKFTGFDSIKPGKCILRGTISQEDDVFGRGPNVQSAAVAVIALSMSLVHKACTWTTPIVDDILHLGDELYGSSLEKLGYDYDPWQHGLTVALVNRDYKVGSLRANFEIRSSDIHGLIHIKHPTIISLSQGIEKFFCKNSYGIIESDTLTVAVWEEDDNPGYYYLYDPNPRSITGVSVDGGVACLLILNSFKLISEHFISNIPIDQRCGEFVITAVEIVVGEVRAKHKGVNVCECKPGEFDLDTRYPKTACDKKHLRKIAEDERKRKEAVRIAKVGKYDYYTMKNGDAILRGNKSQSSKCYSKHSRGNQDITNCLAAFVVHQLSPISTWHFKHIDMILDVGDQLYKDSYVTYNPKNVKLGMANVLRKIFVKEVEVTLDVYKPVMRNVLSVAKLELALVNYFQQESFGILSTENEHVALFFKEGYYYMFVPHSRDVDGNNAKDGVACVMKFDNITNIVAKYFNNVSTMNSGAEFSITLVTVGSIVKLPMMGPCCVPHV